MKKKYFNLFCIILILFLDNCNTTIITQIPTSEGKLCIYPERKNGTLPESQKQFHFVYLKSGDIRIQFDKQEEDCYYFTRLPVGKVFQLDSVGNLNISEYWFKWKNDGKLSRGIKRRLFRRKKGKPRWLECVGGTKYNVSRYT